MKDEVVLPEEFINNIETYLDDAMQFRRNKVTILQDRVIPSAVLLNYKTYEELTGEEEEKKAQQQTKKLLISHHPAHPWLRKEKWAPGGAAPPPPPPQGTNTQVRAQWRPTYSKILWQKQAKLANSWTASGRELQVQADLGNDSMVRIDLANTIRGTYSTHAANN